MKTKIHCMRVSFTLILCMMSIIAVLSPAAHGQVPADEISAIAQSTFLISGVSADGAPLLGTGFVLIREDTKNPGTGNYLLITANHVFKEMGKDEVTISGRSLDGDKWTKLELQLKIKENGVPLYQYDDQKDVAAIRLPGFPGTARPGFSTSLLATNEDLVKYGVNMGTQVFVLGYPFGFMSNDVGFPLMRSGYVASYPVSPTSDYPTFYIDSPIVPGNSGGPVLFFLPNPIYDNAIHMGMTKILFAGLITEWRYFPQKALIPSIKEDSILSVQLGVVVQAQIIKDLIDKIP